MVKLGQDLSLIAFSCELWAKPPFNDSGTSSTPDWNKPHPHSGHVPQRPWEMTSHGYVDKNDDYVGAPPLLRHRRDLRQTCVRAPSAPCSSSTVVCNRLKSGLVLHNFSRDIPCVCVILAVPFFAHHNLRRKSYKAWENLNRKANTPQCTNPPVERNSWR